MMQSMKVRVIAVLLAASTSAAAQGPLRHPAPGDTLRYHDTTTIVTSLTFTDPAVLAEEPTGTIVSTYEFDSRITVAYSTGDSVRFRYDAATVKTTNENGASTRTQDEVMNREFVTTMSANPGYDFAFRSPVGPLSIGRTWADTSRSTGVDGASQPRPPTITQYAVVEDTVLVGERAFVIWMTETTAARAVRAPASNEDFVAGASSAATVRRGQVYLSAMRGIVLSRTTTSSTELTAMIHGYPAAGTRTIAETVTLIR
jgi:hypothetical protein